MAILLGAGNQNNPPTASLGVSAPPAPTPVSTGKSVKAATKKKLLGGDAVTQAEAVDSATLSGVSPTFGDFAKSAMIGAGFTSFGGPFKAAAAAASGIASMPNNLNADARFAPAVKAAAAKMPSNMNPKMAASMAVQAAAKELEAKDKAADLGGSKSGGTHASKGARAKGPAGSKGGPMSGAA